jgi:septal ring factor EnvC (AmiA/AmiB activator)
VGKSQIAENQAKAGEAKQKGDAAETKAERQEKEKRETTKDLERRIENNLAVLYEKLGVNKNEANDALKRLRDKAAKDPAAAARLKELQPFIDKVDASRAKLDAWEAKAAAPAPAPAVKALPSGAVLVGKSGGKNVYQLPDGTRYIQK